ncbi:protein NOI4 [Sesamum angolense]|uniref:Protein NOI4 n=1 Tax=Sesamum angolense TaxID=2727404 RepID=A0AAE1WGQ5_9LAMI|nr:protein NOI4 [Sesamum angolense]
MVKKRWKFEEVVVACVEDRKPRTEHEKGRPLPKFGEWDVNNPASADGFTVIFAKARDEKKANGTAAAAASQPSFDKKVALLYLKCRCSLDGKHGVEKCRVQIGHIQLRVGE